MDKMAAALNVDAVFMRQRRPELQVLLSGIVEEAELADLDA